MTYKTHKHTTQKGKYQMKSIIAAIALTATQASADPCVEIGTLAEVMMKHRQAGTSISTLMAKTEGNDLFVEMLIAAYDQPRFSTTEYQQREIEDFRNTWEIGCYQAMME